MTAKTYPTIIYVANFKDIFWNNNSDLYPSTVPNVDLYTEINNVRPVFLNPHTATIVLEGVFNHCIYDGEYYKLLKIKTIDVVRKRFEYQMEYDVMLNVLASECEVRGTLVRTNKPEILSECLQSTIPILENPTVNVVGGFDIKDFDWRKDVEIKFPDIVIKDYDISLTAWAQFINRLKSNPYITAIKMDGKWDTSKAARSQKHSINPLFVVDMLQKSESISWKNEVLSMVSDFLSDLSEVDIRVQSTIAGSVLQGKKCLTPKTAAIGDVIDETSKIERIDLSTLTDIVMIDHNMKAISEKNPNSYFRRFEKNKLSDDLIIEPIEPKDLFWYAKLSRKPHLPLKPKGVNIDEKQAFLPIDSDKDYYPRLKNYEETEYSGFPPQILNLKENVERKNAKKGWLWYINRIDFAMIDGWRGWYEGDNKQYIPFNQRSYFDDGKDYGARYFFRKLDRRSIPPLGFLIYQLNLKHQDWDDYEYLKENPLKGIQYRSGLNKAILNTNEESNWWGAASQAIRALNGIEELSLFLLQLDFLNWMCVAPSAAGYTQKWFDDNLWGYQNFHKCQQHSPSWATWPCEFLNWDLCGNGVTFSNPIRDNNTAFQHILYRQSLLDSVSLYDNLNFKYETIYLDTKNKPIIKDVVIKQGDIFCSDLEWTFKETPFQINELPFELSRKIIEQISRDVIGGAAAVPGVVGAGMIGRSVLETLRFRKWVDIGQRMSEYARLRGLPGLDVATKEGLATQVRVGLGKSYGLLKEVRYFNHAWKAKGLTRAVRFKKSALFIGKEFLSKAKNIRGIVAGIRAGFTTARAVAGLKTLGVSLALEGVIYGVEAIVNAHKHDNANRQKNSIYTMGDFFGGSEIPTHLWNGCLVVYIHKGEVKYGVYRLYGQNLELSQSEYQILDNVNGTTSRETLFHHIEYLGTINLKGADIFPEEIQSDLIAKAYGAARETGSDKVIHITKEELHDVSNNEFMLFDLVGTNWIACIRAGKVHLICKENDVSFKTIQGSTHKLVFKKAENPSIYKIINQKSTLNVFTQSFPLNTKFNFEDDSNFRLYVAPITHDYGIPEDETNLSEDQKLKNKKQKEIQSKSFLDYYHIKIDTPHDYLNTWVQVFKRRGTALTEINPADFEILKTQRQQIMDNRWVDQLNNYNYLTDVKTNVTRRYEALDTKWWESITGLGERAGIGFAAGLIKRGNVGSALTGAAFGASSQAIASARFWHTDYNQQKNIIREDEERVYRDNSLSEYARKQNYEHELKKSLIKLNSITNAYVQPTTTDDDIQKIFNKGNNWENINVQTLLPSPEQEIEIIRIYEEFGCTCLSDWYLNKPLTLRSGMEPGVFHFLNLASKGLKGKLVHDPWINETLRICLNNGVRFVDHIYEAMQEEEWTIVIPKGVEIDFNIDQISDWSREVWDTYRLKKPKSEILEILKKTKNFGLTDEEYAANKDKLEGKDDEELLKNIDQIIGHRQQGAIFVIPTVTQEDVEISLIHSLKSRVKELESEIEQKTQDINNCEQEVEKLKELKKVWQECEKDRLEAINQMTTLQTELNTCNDDKNNLEQQLKDCRAEVVRVKQYGDTCNRVNTQKIKELEGKIKDCEDRMKEKQIEIDAAKEGLTAHTGRIGDLNKQIQELQKEVAEKQKAFEQATRRAETLHEQYQRLEKEKKDFENAAKNYESQAKTAREEKKEAVESTKRKFKIDVDNIIKSLGGWVSQDLLPTINVDNLESIIKSISDIVSVKNAELDALKNQKLLLEDQKNDIERQLRECDAREVELQNDKTAKDELIKSNEATIKGLQQDKTLLQNQIEELKKTAATSKVGLKCGELLALVDAKYNYEPQIRDDGNSDFTDLVFQLAKGLWEIERGHMDVHLMLFDQMKPLMKIILNDLQNYPIVDKAYDLINSPAYSKYLHFKQHGGDANGEVDRLIQLENNIKTMVTAPVVLGLKNIVDEMSWLAHKAQSNLQEHKDDESLQFFFAHVFPGKELNGIYNKIYKSNPKLAIIRKKFTETGCDVEGADSDEYLKSIFDSTDEVLNKDFLPKSTLTDPPTLPKYTPKVCWVENYNKSTPLNPEKILYYVDAFGNPPPLNEHLLMEHFSLDSSGTFALPKSTYRKGCPLNTSGFDWKFTVDNIYIIPTWSYQYIGSTRYTPVNFYLTGLSKHQMPACYVNSKKTNEQVVDKIQQNRVNLWKNKNTIIVPDDILSKIAKGSYTITVTVRNRMRYKTGKGWDDTRDKLPLIDQSDQIDLVKTFGRGFAVDALRLLSILASNKIYWSKMGIVSTYLDAFVINSSSTNSTNTVTSNFISQQNLVMGDMEFYDIYSLLSFVYKYVKNPQLELENTYNNSSKYFKWRELIQKIHEQTKS